MAAVVLLASGSPPSLGYIHRIRQYARRCLPSYGSTRICPLGPYTSSYCPDVWNTASHELPAESISLSPDRWGRTNDLHTTRFLAHPRGIPLLDPPSSFPLLHLSLCLPLEPS